MIREATEADIPRILEMGRRFLAEGPYHGEIEDNPEVSERLVQILVQNPNAKILVSDEDGALTGLVVFLFYAHYFSGKPTAGELIWFVEPEHRRGFTGIALLRAAQRIAKEMGATSMQFTAPATNTADPKVGKMYEILGYHPVEVSYQKRL